MVLLALVFLGSGIFIVGPEERAIKLRMGRVVGQGRGAVLEPGLHWSLPYPIEEYQKVSVNGIKKVKSTVGWYATTPAQEAAGTEPPAGGTLNPAVDGYVLTADGNIIHTRATLTYRITDPVGYIFNFVNASNLVQSALDNALLSTASQFKVDDILMNDFAGFKEAVRQRVRELADKQNLGIVVEECQVDRQPPRQLMQAFTEAWAAGARRNGLLNDASSDENRMLSKAVADAQSLTNLAAAERTLLLAEVQAGARQFRDLLPRYKDSPDLFLQRHLTETLGRALTNVQDKIFVTEGANGNPKELRFLFNRELPKQKTEEAKP
jgi:membrane protease subunit HflK